MNFKLRHYLAFDDYQVAFNYLSVTGKEKFLADQLEPQTKSAFLSQLLDEVWQSASLLSFKYKL